MVTVINEMEVVPGGSSAPAPAATLTPQPRPTIRPAELARLERRVDERAARVRAH